MAFRIDTTVCRHCVWTCALTFLVGSGSSVSHAQVVYDAVTDFSSTTNSATSTWSYRRRPGTLRDGNYTLLPGYTPAEGTWSPVNPGAWSGVPQVGVNRTGSDATFTNGPAFVWPNNSMLVHPGSIELVILSWLAPSSGLANIVYSFRDLDPNFNNGVLWFVERNNANTTLNSGTFANGGASGTLSLVNVPVNAGDRLNFIVDPNNDFFFDSTQVSATITFVPEPSALTLTGLAIASAIGGRWRKRNSGSKR